MLRQYDLMVLIDPNAPEERRSEILAGVRSMIESSGTLVAEHDWGIRRTTFEIDHRPEAAYHLFQLEAENDLLERLRHHLGITDGVLRSRTFRARPGAEAPAPPAGARAEPAQREEEPETQVAPRAAADAPSQ